MKYSPLTNNYYNPDSDRTNNLFVLYQKPVYKRAINELNRPSFPFVTSLELTNYCHLKCLFCARSVMTRPKGYMDMYFFHKILDELREHKTFIKINGYGENLLHPCVDAIITQIKKENGLYFTSNCQNLQVKTIDTMIGNKVDVLQVSFQGTGKESYETQRKGSKFSNLIKCIKLLVKQRGEEEYPFVHLSTTILDETVEQIESFIRFWFDIGVDSVGIGRTDYDRVINDMITKPLLKAKIRKFKGRQTLKKISNHSYLYRYCDICWDGVVVSSFFDFDQFVPVGDLRKDYLHTIWNKSDVLKSLRILEEKRLINKMKVFDTFYHAWHGGAGSYNLG